ncbi:MAG: hypothetical protein ACOCQO_03105 [Halanaerobiaceae bacterium]
MIINSYKLRDNIYFIRCKQDSIEGILNIDIEKDIDILHLNIIYKKVSIYFKKSNLKNIEKKISNNKDYEIKGPFAMINIDYTKEDLMKQVVNIAELLFEENIVFDEMGIMENKLYIILKQKYKNKFIYLYDKIT